MPYYQPAWNDILDKNKKQEDDKSHTKKLSSDPKDESPPNEEEDNFQRQSHSDIKTIQILFGRELLKKQVNLLNNVIEAAQPVEKNEKKFANYKINYNKEFFKGQFSELYEAFNYKLTDNVLICRVFEPSSLIDPIKDTYLKILRQIGKKHPCIIATWDIFYDEYNRIFLFQEFANYGNGQDFMRKELPLEEGQVLHWAQSIYRGLEFLSDIGIAHRSIHPKHVLVKRAVGATDVQVKLSGFRSAVIYWDALKNDIIDQPCRPLALKNFTNFQAPEVFGDQGEYFNPIDADIWSFGAVMFTLVTRVYPYNILNNNPTNVDEEIKATIYSIANLSESAKAWFYGLMRANLEKRFDFHEIKRQPWFKNSGNTTPISTLLNTSQCAKSEDDCKIFSEVPLKPCTSTQHQAHESCIQLEKDNKDAPDETLLSQSNQAGEPNESCEIIGGGEFHPFFLPSSSKPEEAKKTSISPGFENFIDLSMEKTKADTVGDQ